MTPDLETLETHADLVEGARALLDAAEADSQALLQGLLARAITARTQGRLEEAAQLAGLATDLDPWHAPAWAERAAASLALGEPTWARYFAFRALGTYPHFTHLTRPQGVASKA